MHSAAVCVAAIADIRLLRSTGCSRPQAVIRRNRTNRSVRAASIASRKDEGRPRAHGLGDETIVRSRSLRHGKHGEDRRIRQLDRLGFHGESIGAAPESQQSASPFRARCIPGRPDRPLACQQERARPMVKRRKGPSPRLHMRAMRASRPRLVEFSCDG